MIVIAIVGAAVFLGTRPTATGPTTLTLAIWTGPTKDGIEWFADEARRELNLDARFIWQGGAGETFSRLQLSPKRQSIDLWGAFETVALRAMEAGFLEPIPEDKVPNIKLVDEKFKIRGTDGQVYFVAAWGLQYGIGYREDLVGPIKSYKDLWTRPDLAGKITIPAIFIATGYPILHVSKIWGGDEFNVDIGWQKLKELAPSVKAVWSSDADSMKWLISGEIPVQLTLTGNAALAALQNPGLNIKMVSPGTPPLLILDGIVIVKNSPAPLEAKYRWLNMFLDPKINQEFANRITEIPLVKGAEMDPKVAPFHNLGTTWIPDMAERNKKFADWSARWRTEVEPLLGKR